MSHDRVPLPGTGPPRRRVAGVGLTPQQWVKLTAALCATVFVLVFGAVLFVGGAL